MSKKFKKKATIYKLRFEGADDELDGLEVTMRSLPIQQFMEVTEMASAAAEDPRLGAKNTLLMFQVFASALVDWNLTDEFNEDVPATLDGVLKQELDFILRIFGAWQEQIGGVPGPLRSASSSGKQSLEASLPMEPSSPNPPN